MRCRKRWLRNWELSRINTFTLGIQLKALSVSELPAISRLAEKIWQAYYPPIVGQAQVEYMLKKFYALDALEKQQQEGQTFYLIEDESNAIGFISISGKSDGHFFIHKFYIDSDQQGKGVGKIVFEQIKLLLKSDALTSIKLTVNRQNFKAINFYFNIGFSIKEVADFDIGNGYVMNDFVMEWQGK